MNADSRVDMVAIDSSGRMLVYAGNGLGGWAATPTQIGAGWQIAVPQVAD